MLDDRISPLQVSHNALTSQFGNLQIEVQQSIHAHDARITAVETQIASVQASAVDGQARESIQRVEQQLKLFSIIISEESRSSNIHPTAHMPKDARVSDDQSLTVVMGNLDNKSIEAHCTSWMTKQIESICHVSPTRTYVKGEFRGMLWMVFASQSQRDLVVEFLNKQKVAMTSRVIWVAPDLPLPMRVEKKFLFALKKLLLTWGWQGFETRVDISSRSLSIDGKVIVVVDAHDQQFDVRFADQWQDRLKDDALDKLFLDCQAMMIKRRVGKGFSKGQ